ncbi:MAG: tRNA uridine-5-carboxymethylaminomethyl(34) synthesis GTPase MnmE [Puniceicoccales bacterium]|jgi:tRNA modification GTPase|nr:tRNA uridine-5-carboxymethylaminomethyl(34) synthesis GTPase MnmE [Puniceicoccales bacterium]
MRHETIAALATPRGISALAVIRVSGMLCGNLFESFAGIRKFSPETFHHRKYFSLAGELIDDVLMVFFASPNSYSGEDSIEIYCHGNMLIVEKILVDLYSRGCCPAGPGEFTRRAFMNGKLDLSQAEAVADVIHANSERAIAVAQNQLEGALSEKINSIGKDLLSVLAEIEREIDFSDDEILAENFPASILGKLEKSSKELENLMESNRYRSLLDEGVSAIILGEPNAGKSSLFNFLLGKDRAIVSEIAGTTRDIVSERITIGNNVLKIFDSAGLHSNPMCKIEEIGIAKAIAAAKKADLFLIVLDSNAKRLPKIPREIAGLFQTSNALLVVNKVDLRRNCDSENFLTHLKRIEISIKNESDLQLLRNKILEILNSNDSLNCDVDVIVNSRHVDILRRSHELLLRAKSELEKKTNLEIIVSDIHQAFEILGEISGGYDRERVLDAVFANFCVGK